MKTVVITGSGRGLGFEMAKRFRAQGMNVVLNDIHAERLSEAKAELEKLPGAGKVCAFAGNAAAYADLQALAAHAVSQCGAVDIWINNAGVNQPMKAVWELTVEEIGVLLDVDLRGAILGCKAAMEVMLKQGHGAIYNLEGYGSNDAMMLGLNMYGTTKRAVTHFTQAMANECEERGTGVIVGRLSPGIMITDFTVKALGDKEAIDLPEKTKKVYNILGDYPDVVADFLVARVIANTKNNAHIQWLTGGKAMWRFMTAGFSKRDFFAGK
ncbi:MAG: SDR family oxidoreductase [Clostridia bacterium]|nr:SDR family oxidoreductase [Clostridia bacterium]